MNKQIKCKFLSETLQEKELTLEECYFSNSIYWKKLFNINEWSEVDCTRNNINIEFDYNEHDMLVFCDDIKDIYSGTNIFILESIYYYNNDIQNKGKLIIDIEKYSTFIKNKKVYKLNNYSKSIELSILKYKEDEAEYRFIINNDNEKFLFKNNLYNSYISNLNEPNINTLTDIIYNDHIIKIKKIMYKRIDILLELKNNKL